MPGTTASKPHPLSSFLRTVLTLAGALDLVLGILFLLGPEIGVKLWPTDVAPLMSRFIGSIVFASGVGVLVLARMGTWEGARALFYVGLAYSLLTLAALLYHLIFKAAPQVFWLYTVLDIVYLVPISYVIWANDRK